MIHLCGAVTVNIQEVEEAAMLFIPAVLIGELHELVDGRPLESLVLLLGADLEQEPAGLQGVA